MPDQTGEVCVLVLWGWTPLVATQPCEILMSVTFEVRDAIFNDRSIAKILLSAPVRDWPKSVNIWWTCEVNDIWMFMDGPHWWQRDAAISTLLQCSCMSAVQYPATGTTAVFQLLVIALVLSRCPGYLRNYPVSQKNYANLFFAPCLSNMNRFQ